MAEGIFTSLINNKGLQSAYVIDSAGTTDNFMGRAPDKRAQDKCHEHGIDISAQKSRPIEEYDFEIYDCIICMDRYNVDALNNMAPSKYQSKIQLLLAFDGSNNVTEVSDPYYDRVHGFDVVYDLISSACTALFEHLETE